MEYYVKNEDMSSQLVSSSAVPPVFEIVFKTRVINKSRTLRTLCLLRLDVTVADVRDPTFVYIVG